MSLAALTEQVIAELERARDLFGPAPRAADWGSTETLTFARDGITGSAIGRGAGAGSYRDAADTTADALGNAIGADQTTSAGMAAAAESARDGRAALAAIVDDAKSGAAAIDSGVDTPAGRKQLVMHLQHQLIRARAVLAAAAQRNSAIAAEIRAGVDGYRQTGGRAASRGGGPKAGLP